MMVKTQSFFQVRFPYYLLSLFILSFVSGLPLSASASQKDSDRESSINSKSSHALKSKKSHNSKTQGKKIEKKESSKSSVSLPPAPIAAEETFQPYFAALRGRKVYMRRGPGSNYPIDWVYYRRGLPVKVSRKFQNWCQVEDNFGEKGWMHQATLRSSRNVVVLSSSKNKEEPKLDAPSPKNKADSERQYDSHVVSYCSSFDNKCALGSFPIYSSPDSKGRPVAFLLPGAVGRVSKCGGEKWKAWCEVNIAGYKGWIEKSHLWGAVDEDSEPK
ncbi:hypothetical protein FAI40_09835 [Acetobacteraceae bacterium]|nr:hypothetical protein FAI40_09835 [Acetobacteraceae bacterium]